jgi:hypothetical protein
MRSPASLTLHFRRSPAAPWRLWAPFIAALGLLVGAAIHYRNNQAERAQTVKDIGVATLPVVATPAARPPSGDEAKLREEQRLVAAHLAVLNADWAPLLTALGPGPVRGVHLLALDVDARSSTWRLQAQAESLSGVLDFAAVLSGRERLIDVVLMRHEQRPPAAVHVTVEGRWRQLP